MFDSDTVLEIVFIVAGVIILTGIILDFVDNL